QHSPPRPGDRVRRQPPASHHQGRRAHLVQRRETRGRPSLCRSYGPARLRPCGLLVRERYSDLNPGQVTGYAVALPGCTGPDGTPRWYGGGGLLDTLTLPRLRNAWAEPHRTAEYCRTPRFTDPECAEIYRHAARQAAAATEHLRRCTPTTPITARTPAWATADALHAAASALHSPILRCAAAGYDRAARAPYGRIPRRSQQGDQLRTAARLLAMTGATA